jgi:hypothetical protein
MRRLSYRHALTAFFFTACWLILGFIFLMTPIPDALGVTGQMIAAWILLFFVCMGLSGALLTLAAINGIWPPVSRTPRGRVPARATVTSTAPDAATQAWTRPLPPRSSSGR